MDNHDQQQLQERPLAGEPPPWSRPLNLVLLVLVIWLSLVWLPGWLVQLLGER